jgi:hypothetical protein
VHEDGGTKDAVKGTVGDRRKDRKRVDGKAAIQGRVEAEAFVDEFGTGIYAESVPAAFQKQGYVTACGATYIQDTAALMESDIEPGLDASGGGAVLFGEEGGVGGVECLSLKIEDIRFIHP